MLAQRILINLLAVTVMLTLLWHNRVAADTLGVYQPTVVRQAQWALQHGDPDHALALLARRGAELRRIDEAVADIKRVAIMNPAAMAINADFSIAGR